MFFGYYDTIYILVKVFQSLDMVHLNIFLYTPNGREVQSLYMSTYSVVEFSSRNAEGSPIAFKATIAAVDFIASGSALANIKPGQNPQLLTISR